MRKCKNFTNYFAKRKQQGRKFMHDYNKDFVR